MKLIDALHINIQEVGKVMDKVIFQHKPKGSEGVNQVESEGNFFQEEGTLNMKRQRKKLAQPEIWQRKQNSQNRESKRLLRGEDIAKMAKGQSM